MNNFDGMRTLENHKIVDERDGRLFNSRCVLSGAIDRVDDDGVQWRNNIKIECEKRNFGIKFFDPCDKPKSLGSEIGKEKIAVKRLVREGRWEEAQELVKIFRHFDLRAIDWCDFVIVKIDINVHACGTYDEIFLAEREHKLILVIMGEGQTKIDIPSWLVAFINEDEVFDTEDECVEYLSKLNSGDIPLDERWVKLD